MLHLHFSNRVEILTAQLLGHLRGPRTDLFQPDTVVVPSTAAKRHLQLAMADAQGVCANVAFVYLARWLWEQVARVLPGVDPESPFDAASLTWRLYALMQDEAFVGEHPVLSGYFAAGEDDPVLAYELSVAAAALMEQYITYRPDWLAGWQQKQDSLFASPHERWQAAAWRRIAADVQVGAAHPMETMVRELERAGAQAARRFALPPRVQIFALASIPPLYLRALQSLARFVDIHVHAPSPSPEYWFDLVDPRRLEKLRAAGKAEGFEVRHRLLTSWGGQTQAALDQLVRLDESDRTAWISEYEPSGRSTLLGRLQDSMLELEDLQPASVRLDPADRSLEVHVCHSLTRELEVLHDQLLGWFKADPSLRPSDILVVTPDIDTAAPLVEAVFGTVPKAREIPFALTGRPRSSVNAPAKAFLELLALAASRCTATDVFSLLQQPVVRRRFALTEDALAQVHTWLVEAGIHWGLDAQHVAAQQLPAQVSHTLRDGLARLFLGHALPDGAAEPLAGCLPVAAAEGSGAAALGALWTFTERLQRLAGELQRPRTPQAWSELLRGTAESFLLADAREADDWLELLHAFDALSGAMQRSGLTNDVPAPVVRAALERELDDAAHGGTPTGRVTFTGMSSLRHLPFRVVCAIGLNDGAFPTRDRPAEFDLMAADPRPGDRQRRSDQRNLFLDLLLSARERFYISYTGRSIRDNTALPPSVLVSELLDVLVPAIAEDGHSEAALQKARARLVVEHPLQPFSPAAFERHGDSRIRSFDAELAAALRESLAGHRVEIADPAAEAGEDDDAPEDDESHLQPALKFFPQPLAAPGAEWRTLPLRRLLEFFRNPSRYLLRRRLRIELARDEAALEDDEPLLADYQGRSRLAERLLPHLLAGADRDTARRLAEAGTELPSGPAGAAEREAEVDAMLRFAAAVRREAHGDPLPPQTASVELEVRGAPWRIETTWSDLRPQGLVRSRFDDERATDVLEAWLAHLLLCANPPQGVQPRTTWVARGACSIYEAMPVPEARRRLAELVGLYEIGLAQPLDFFPKTAWEQVRGASVGDVQRKWTGKGGWPGERAHPAYVLAWRGVPEPLGETFEERARTVFGDLPVTRIPLAELEAAA